MEKGKFPAKGARWIKSRGAVHEDSSSDEDPGSDPSDFFASPPLLASLVVLIGLIAYEVLCFQTNSFPFHLLGVPGQRLKYLSDNYLAQLRLGALATLIIHVGECVYVYLCCSRLGISQKTTNKWMLQTFIFGFLSLRLLQKHEAEIKKDNRRR